MSVATLTPPAASPDMAAAGSLRVDKANVYYRDSQALRDVSIDVPAGTVVSLLGRNGVGKTTLLKAIMGLLPVRRGSIHFGAQDITRAPTHRRAWAGIGYVPQGRGIFPYLSVYENLQIAAETKGGGGAAAIEEMLELFPALKIYVKKSGGSLSGGQQQQLAIARALARRPSLLVLDEPTEGIQPNIVLEIEQTIQALAEKNLTILLVEQFLDFALTVGDSYYVMSHGTIVANGPTQGLDPESIKHYIAI
jgi:urea transport system ATP-binding protein